MGYIRLSISKSTDNSGRSTEARIKHIYSDTGVSSYDLNRIMHALSAPSSYIEKWMVLGEGVLDRDKLKGREYLILDSGTIDVDYVL